jgi:hypothetical protein
MGLSQKTNTIWNGNGCYIDTAGCILQGYTASGSSNSAEKCCLKRGFEHAATQIGMQCFCGNEVVKSGLLGLQTSVAPSVTRNVQVRFRFSVPYVPRCSNDKFLGALSQTMVPI